MERRRGRAADTGEVVSWPVRLCLALIIAGAVLEPPCGAPAVVAAARLPWVLAWSDEFNGLAESPDDARWTADVGGDGSGNEELEYYTGRVENGYLDGRGHLAITARKAQLPGSSRWYGRCTYTPARLVTRHRLSVLYGRIAARIKIPVGQGYR
jgi:beta-glucanase (GH16 family)